MQPFIFKRATDFPTTEAWAGKNQGSFLGALYAEDFDAPPPAPAPAAPPEPAPPPEPVEPVYTAADLAAAREDGRQAGRTESERSLAAARLQRLDQIANFLAASQASADAVAEAAADAIARTMLSALAACLPALCAQHGAGEVRAVIQAVLPGLAHEPRITVRVNPLLIPAMTAEIADLDSEVAERLLLVPVESMAPGDVRVNWQDGAAIRETGRVCAAVNDVLASLGLLEQEMISA